MEAPVNQCQGSPDGGSLPPFAIDKNEINPIFRAKLRLWEAEKLAADRGIKITQDIGGITSNVVNIASNLGTFAEFDLATQQDEYSSNEQSVPLGEDYMDVGADRTYLVPGDMVALKYFTFNLR